MRSYPKPLQKLIRELAKFPTVGEKTATRLAYFLISSPAEVGAEMAEAITEAVSTIRFCDQCFNISEAELCIVCQDPERDGSTLCVVEKPMDIMALERVGEYRGLYHVLHGLWAPLRGKGTESIKLAELLERIEREPVSEVILATSSTVEGDATALFIARQLEDKEITLSRPAQGLPKGGELEYADDVTLSRAFAGRGALL